MLPALLCFSSLLLAQIGTAVSQRRDESSVKKLTLEEMVEIQVTSVSSAIHAITQEGIRRSGVRRIAEELCL